MDVRVLGTTVSPAAECDDVTPRFYGRYYPVATETDLRNALNAILEELGLPKPKIHPGAGDVLDRR